MNQNKYRSFVLPIAIVLGFLLHGCCAYLKFLIPYFIFTILLTNYSAVDIRKMKPGKLEFELLLVQIAGCILPYLVLHLLGVDEIISQGILMVFLCPVAAAVVVVACILGANRETVTSFTIIDNLVIAVLAPLLFSLVGEHRELGFLTAFLMIFRKTFLIIAFPFILALLGQRFAPKLNATICRFKDASFYIWALTLTITLGQTIDFLFTSGKGHGASIILLGSLSVLICIFLFAFGRWIGKRHGDKIAGGQLLGQKNVAIGVWMANTFLNPLPSVGLALYSIWQNVFNSWQMWNANKK